MIGARSRSRASLALAVLLLLCGAARGADVTVELQRMGVGSHVRPGDPTGILVRLTSSLMEPVQTRVQWELRNADGDTALYARDVPLAPGAPTDRWLYGVLPMQSASALGALDMVTVVRVLQLEDGRVTRELAVARIDGSLAAVAPTGVEVNEGLIGVLGDGRAGLVALSPAPGVGSQSVVPSMNENTRIARGMDAATLPDRWEGLASYSAIVWGNAPVQNLAPESARALLDWVHRGGHLVILLPESGDPWGLQAGRGGRTALAEVLPNGGVARNEGVLVRDLMPLISRTSELRNDLARTTLWTFDPAAARGGYEAVMAMPCAVDTRTGLLAPTPDTLQGKVVAVRRPLGFGAVTLVGIDADGLDRRSLNSDGLPQADIFWNRLLGRRADAPSAREWTEIEAAKRLDTKGVANVAADGGTLFSGEIGMSGAAAIGLLGLIAAFGVYWLLAGPGVFYVLRGLRKTQYAWLGFVLVAAAATVVAWMATGVKEFARGRLKHVTYLDRVDSPSFTAEERAVVRAQSWFSAELPGYGPTRVSMRKGVGSAGGDAIWTWFAPPSGSNAGFPDTERYLVPLGATADYLAPSRATSAVFSSSWMGDPLGAWSGLPHAAAGSTLRQDLTWESETVPRVIVHGQIVHNLPGALEDVHIIHINPMRSPQRTQTAGTPPTIKPSGMLPNYGRIQTVPRWEPNTPLDVASVLYPGTAKEGKPTAVPARGVDTNFGLAENLKKLYANPVLQNPVYMGMKDPFNAVQRLELLNYYSMLQPPEYLLTANAAAAPNQGYSMPTSARVERDMARGVDLGLWFTRPCLIVVGTLVDDDLSAVESPFPIEIGGKVPDAQGRTIVRVIFLLPDSLGTMAPPLP